MPNHPDDIVRWCDGTEATWGEVCAGEYDWMSDDYEVIPLEETECE